MIDPTVMQITPAELDRKIQQAVATATERGIDEGLIRALGIVTSTPDQTAFGCAKAIRNELERRRINEY